MERRAVELSPQIRRFLGLPGRHAVLATVNPDGTPHQSVIWYLVRDDQLVLNSLPGRRWPANARRQPRVSLVVENGWDQVTLTGEIEVPAADVEMARREVAEMAQRYMAPEESAAIIEQRFSKEPRVRFIFRPTSIHTHGDPR